MEVSRGENLINHYLKTREEVRNFRNTLFEMPKGMSRIVVGEVEGNFLTGKISVSFGKSYPSLLTNLRKT